MTRRNWLEVLLIFFVFFLEGAYLVPDTNEAHYLGKAARFWNPDYAPGDFLLSTPDAHGVFVWTVGWLTVLLPLPVVAWIGRLATWFGLAFFWQKLSWKLIPLPWTSVVTAGAFVCLNAQFHLAGEWVVGGFEAKSIAFVFVFWGLSELVSGNWNRVWILFGLASMFHVLVGGWSVVAAGLSWVYMPVKERPTLKSFWKGLVLGGLLSLPGLLPVLLLNMGTDPETTLRANRLYVYYRLPHHVLLTALPSWYVLRFCLISVTAVFLMTRSCVIENLPARRLQGWVAGSLTIAVLGAAWSGLSKSYPDSMAALLRFYWFRLSDMAVPLGIALLGGFIYYQLRFENVSSTGERSAPKKTPKRAFVLAALILFLAAGETLINVNRLLFPIPPRQCGLAANYAYWLDACTWAKENTPPDALFVVPKMARTFTWYSERGTVVNWKDVPQDAKGLNEWWNRVHAFYLRPDPERPGKFYWTDSLALQPQKRLIAAAKRYGASYLITNARTPIDLPKAYENRYMTIYQFPKE